MNENFSKHLKTVYRAKTAREAVENMKKAQYGDTYTRVYVVEKDHHVVLDGLLKDGENFNNSKFVQNCILNPEYQKLISWANRNIVAQLTSDHYKTTDVKVRIWTGMLNKSSVDKDDAILMHLALIRNVETVRWEIIDEELPF